MHPWGLVETYITRPYDTNEDHSENINTTHPPLLRCRHSPGQLKKCCKAVAKKSGDDSTHPMLKAKPVWHCITASQWQSSRSHAHLVPGLGGLMGGVVGAKTTDCAWAQEGKVVESEIASAFDSHQMRWADQCYDASRPADGRRRGREQSVSVFLRERARC